MSVYFYGCITLDGFLADKNHQLDWLHETGSSEETTYEAFYKKMDVTVMGKRTYDYIKNIPNFEKFYAATKNYVLTSHKDEVSDQFTPISGDIASFIYSLPQDKNIWIIGGNTLVTPLLNRDLFDYLIIQIAPVILGEGVPLFKDITRNLRYELESVSKYGQFVEIVFKKRSK
ncbi:dihydrofolate reductase family protein [Acholeplasma hippikon]|nr:dihydrofolate reductase family protein [Acholeplasma hippikon]